MLLTLGTRQNNCQTNWNTKVCFNPHCGKTEHMIECCFREDREMAVQYTSWWKSNLRRVLTAQASVTQMLNAATPTPTFTPLSVQANITTPSTSTVKHYELSMLAGNGYGDKLFTYLDSGASEHFFIQCEDSLAYHKLEISLSVVETQLMELLSILRVWEKLERLLVLGKGILMLSLPRSSMLPRYVAIPYLLISVGCLDKAGFCYEITRKHVIVKDGKGLTFLKKPANDTMYKVNFVDASTYTIVAHSLN